MLNLLKKSTPWMVASLFVATSVFGQQATNKDAAAPNSCAPKCAPKCPPKPCAKPCPQPTPPTQVCPTDACCPPWSTPVLNAAYNYPARTQTRCPWDINFDVSFIYWQPVQENMKIGVLRTTPIAAPLADNIANSEINMDFDFKPGFKIGMGGYFDHDGWDMRFEYTWFHNTNSKSEGTAEGETIFAAYGNPSITSSDVFTKASGKWQLNMDIAELDLGRWYYVGTKLTFRPNFGLRAAWIGQKLNVNYDYPATTLNPNAQLQVSQKSSSWAIGAKTGLDTNWTICSGFRLFGNAEADLLFTKYTNVRSNETFASLTPARGSVKVKQSKVYAVKPHLDLELGLGWGTYLDCNNYYMDFALGYEFQVFFDQNMFRHFTDVATIANSNLPNGNLYLNGLTFTAKLDF